MPKSKSLLITRPDFDDTTAYCSAWSNEIIEKATERGFEILDLPKQKATRKEFEGRMEKSNLVFVMLNGHGTPYEVEGHKDNIILKKGENEQLTQGKIVYALSCYSLAQLGQACCDVGALGYIGYTLPFFFVLDPKQGAHPLNDEFAKPCFTASNLIAISIIKGQTIAEAVRKSKEESDKLKAYWQTRPEIEAPFVASTISWNSSCLEYRGLPDAAL